MWFKKIEKNPPIEKVQEIAPGSLEDLWVEHIELRGAVNKLLTTLNKTLRAHGRTIQNENTAPQVQNKPRKGIMRP